MVNAVSSNESQKSNTGKIVGAGLASAYSGYRISKHLKEYKEMDEFMASAPAKNAFGKGNLELIKKAIKESKVTEKYKNKLTASFEILAATAKLAAEKTANVFKDFSINYPKTTKFRTHYLVGMTALTVGLGIGLGAIIDSVTNKHKK